MEVFVKFEVFDTIYEREDVLAIRQGADQNFMLLACYKGNEG